MADNQEELELEDGSADEKPKEMADGAAEETELTDGTDEEVALEDGAADEAELQDEAEVSADSYLDAIAATAGLDRAATLAILMDKLDDVAAMVAGVAAVDGNASEQAPAAELAEKLIERNGRVVTPGAGAANVNELKAMKLEMQAQKRTILALTQDKAKRDDVAKAEKASAIESEVDGLIDTGYVLDADRKDAIWLFSNDPERARRIYANKVVPIDEDAAGETPPASKEAAKVVDLSQLSEPQVGLYNTLVAARYGGGLKGSADKLKCFNKALAGN
jgi:hypothetical protein